MNIRKTFRIFILVALLTLGTLSASAWGSLAAGVVQVPLAPGNPVINPAANDHTVPVTSTVSITYDEDIDPSTVNQQTFAVQAMQTGLLTETFSVNGGEILLTPNHPFKPGELVQVSATTGTLGLPGGEGPTEPTVWQFRTTVGGDGTGAMIPHPTTPQFGAGTSRGIVIGDIDGDGDPDAVVGNTDNQAETVWLNDGSGNFSPHPATPSFGSGYTHDVDLGDLDSDGDLDAVIINSQLQAHTIWLNDGNGAFSPHPTTPSFGKNWYSYAGTLGDLDGDGDLDVLIAECGTFNNAENVWLNDGTGSFSPHPTTPEFGGGISRDIALGDLDYDGDLDAIVANDGSANTVWLNDGNGNFTAHPSTPNFGGSGTSFGAALGDLDGDTDLDVAIVGWDELETIWVNDGAGGLTPHPTTPSFDGGDSSHDIEFGDFDADGDLDLLVANVGPDTIWVNDGTGNFSLGPGGNFGGGSSFETVAGDIDSDGDLDVLFANMSNQPETVWLNQSQADLAISKSREPNDAILPGHPITYTLSFTNLGQQTAIGVVITDVIPAEIIEIDYASSIPITPTGTVSYTWLIPDLLPGEAGSITFTGRVDPDLINILTFTNTAHITGTSFDAFPTNNISSAIVEINIPPTAMDDSGVDYTTDEETPFTTGNVLANDFDPNGEALSVASYDDSGLLGILTDNGNGSFEYDPNGQFEDLFPGEEAFDLFTYIVTDGVLTDTATVTITVTGVNDSPLVDAGPGQMVDEGDLVQFQGSASDPGLRLPSAVVGLHWDFGDGNTATDTLTPTHTYLDNASPATDGAYTVTLTVTDTHGGIASDWLLVTVKNVSPTLSAFADREAFVDEAITGTGTFSDPGTLDTHTGTIDWGDGTVEAVDVNQVSNTVSGTHAYAIAGIYIITLTLSDDDGGITTTTFTVTVDTTGLIIYLPVVTWRVFTPSP